MTTLNATLLFKKLIIDNWLCNKNKRWHKKKFRYKFALRCLLNPFTTIKYFNGLCTLENSTQLLEARPLLPAKIQRPYLHKALSVQQRAQAILDHYYFVQRLSCESIKAIFLSSRHTLLAYCEGKEGAQIKIFCGPCGYDREGELTLTLFFNEEALVRLSFSFIQHSGKNTVMIAGLQGPCKGVGTNIIRDATKSCYGLFPKRMLYEAFSALIEECGITEVLAVSEDSHVYRQLRYLYQKKKTFVACYSEFWESISGIKMGGLYLLPPHVQRKALECIASKKRSEYRNRHCLLDLIKKEVKNRVNLKNHQIVDMH